MLRASGVRQLQQRGCGGLAAVDLDEGGAGGGGLADVADALAAVSEALVLGVVEVGRVCEVADLLQEGVDEAVAGVVAAEPLADSRVVVSQHLQEPKGECRDTRVCLPLDKRIPRPSGWDVAETAVFGVGTTCPVMVRSNGGHASAEEDVHCTCGRIRSARAIWAGSIRSTLGLML